jgi:hypothetical protein
MILPPPTTGGVSVKEKDFVPAPERSRVEPGTATVL